MEAQASKANRSRPSCDVFDDRKWLILILGFAELRDIIYIGFIKVLYMIYLYVLSMAVHMLSPNKSLMKDAFYVFVSSLYASRGLTYRLFEDRSVRSMRELIKFGIYDYDEDDLEDEPLKMIENIELEMKKKSNTIKLIYGLGLLSNMIFFPLSPVLFLSENDVIHKIKFVNPYLPHIIYITFNSRNLLGYSSSYMSDFFFSAVLYSTGFIISGIYISSTVQIKAYLQVLQYSLRNIQKIAIQMYPKYNTHSQPSQQDLLQRK